MNELVGMSRENRQHALAGFWYTLIIVLLLSLLPSMAAVDESIEDRVQRWEAEAAQRHAEAYERARAEVAKR